MTEERKKQSKDILGNIAKITVSLSSVAVSIVLGVVGLRYSAAIQEREVTIKEATFAREWVKFGLEILHDKSTPSDMRIWAIEVINHYAEVKLGQNLTAGLVAKTTFFPISGAFWQVPMPVHLPPAHPEYSPPER